MYLIGLILLVALLIPIIGIVIDSPIGRAIARRVEGPDPIPPDMQDLGKKVELLELEVDDLNRSVDQLKEENAFIQRLLEDPSARRTLPPPPNT
ncbi:MAG: hypothetical protein E2O47_00995 [Gemmatimonadetes bacterium]|nr:MAG: hypothetical protein E2O47_00995 [Gemmatimonadota bacterium]